MSSATDTAAGPSRQLAGYRIERRLGEGGMGTVYLARDATAAPVALKVMDLGGADATQLRQTFEREVATNRKLNHPGIVRILAAGQAEGLSYIAMEYVAGGDLTGLHAGKRPLPQRKALALAAHVARALSHAHALGVVHRDIKPANILLGEDAGTVKLGDFGLAHLSDLQRSRTGLLVGTPAYMSPEQLAEGPQDARADLYSLGVVLFEMLTGRLPYEASSLGALLREVSRTIPPTVQQLRPETPAALSSLVAQLLEKPRERRPASAQTLAGKLETLQRALPGAASP